ncbi:MAG: nucleotide sugar dehydrogenase [Aestuariivirga sp.]|nr:nucleotide sugar dehydrogenase [Aestuariivirga sp.]
MLALAEFTKLKQLIESRKATIGVCGLGYVGLPLAVATSQAGFKVLGFDIDESKMIQVNMGQSYLGSVSSDALVPLVKTKRLRVTNNFKKLAACDVIIICVPTPLTVNREPDLSYVQRTAKAIAGCLRLGQLVVLESTSYPGTTSHVVKPILLQTGLIAGQDFFLGFSPEREDPGNIDFATATIPKIVAGEGAEAGELTALFYKSVVDRVVVVSSNETAEAVKITENVFRAVNIALVNELKVIFAAMDIDIWEVIEAAKTKPFGFMPFYPGPGLGGHCIPIDPFYLAWKAREFGVPTRFIELAGEINTAMPHYVINRLVETLDGRCAKTLSAARILILGVAYKKNVSDIRESPALKLMELLEKRGAKVDFHDPHVDEMPKTREHPDFTGRRSVPFGSRSIRAYDAVVVVTDHDCIEYQYLEKAKIVVDTRNACAKRGLSLANVVKA